MTALAPPTARPLVEVRAEHVVLATGGAGQLFAVTTNPPESTGDGVAMALRAGVPTADVEFVQFHPTALHHPAMPRPLLSEALRGHGALLRDADGERFVDELAPRDVVSRAMAARMTEQGVDHLWLDATGLERFAARFPTIAASLASIGLDPEKDWMPIAPAAHHLSGGVVTDLWGATALPGLWAVGEVACTGVHGANRLASNSLLEGMVFGARMAEHIERRRRRAPRPAAPCGPCSAPRRSTGSAAPAAGPRRRCGRPSGAGPAPTAWSPAPDIPKLRDSLQRTMTRGPAWCARQPRWPGRPPCSRRGGALGDAGPRWPRSSWPTWCSWPTRCWLGRRRRTESRGAHSRAEYPETEPSWRRRLVHGACRCGMSRRTDAGTRTQAAVDEAVDPGAGRGPRADGDLTAALVPEATMAHFAAAGPPGRRAGRPGLRRGHSAGWAPTSSWTGMPTTATCSTRVTP